MLISPGKQLVVWIVICVLVVIVLGQVLMIHHLCADAPAFSSPPMITIPVANPDSKDPLSELAAQQAHWRPLLKTYSTLAVNARGTVEPASGGLNLEFNVHSLDAAATDFIQADIVLTGTLDHPHTSIRSLKQKGFQGSAAVLKLLSAQNAP